MHPSPTHDPVGADRNAIPPVLVKVCFALAIANAVFLPVAHFNYMWMFDEKGLGIPVDFIGIWAAGKLVLNGEAAQAYVWDVHKQIQTATLGQDFRGIFGWHYPPPFLIVAALLAQLSYPAAFLGWCAASFVPYAIAIRALVGRPFGWLLATAFPALVLNVLIGHNGFLTAALIGGALVLLPTRPVLAGICVGLLTYKPQFGVLFPLVLIAAAQWTVIVSASVTVGVLVILTSLLFGIDTWLAFFHWLPLTSERFLSVGGIIFAKFQSLFSVVRFLGGSEQLAWAFQYTLSGIVAVALVLLWRSRVRYSMKAAALGTGTMLVTPYLFLYDMMVLAVPVALLVRVGLSGGFRAYELPGLGLVAALIMFFPVAAAPTGFLASLVLAALIAGRCLVRRPATVQTPALRATPLQT